MKIYKFYVSGMETSDGSALVPGQKLRAKEWSQKLEEFVGV
jgi:hypothetical protein